MLFLIPLLISIFPAICSSSKCSWQNCPKWKKHFINVHLVPNTHLDAGWLHTFEEYYDQSKKFEIVSKKEYKLAEVKFIIDGVMKELEMDKSRRFTFAETIFLWQWWTRQNNTMKDRLKKLIENGQFEFAGGGWVQNDEAASHYVSIIDQMTLGLRKLNQTFGICGRPKIAWQLDPFGHSREQAALFAQMGFEGLFFARLHFLDREKRFRNKEARFMWHGSDDLGSKANILTGHFGDDTYYPPPILPIDELLKTGQFPKEKVQPFIKYCQNTTNYYKTKHVIFSMCADFGYQDADAWFKTMTQLIELVNAKQSQGSNVNVFYSTPACYVKALHDSHVKWTTKSDDFFPYANKQSSYWTGYFSSRPTFKRFAREMGQLLQASKKFGTLVLLESKFYDKLEVMKEAVGMVQHHDAITGTEKQYVDVDYRIRLSKGLAQCQDLLNDILVKIEPSAASRNICPLLNVSICDVSQNNAKFSMVVFNSQTRLLKDYVHVPCSTEDLVVTGPDGSQIDAQTVSTFNQKSQLGYLKSAPYQILVPVQAPPLGINIYTFSRNAKQQTKSSETALTSPSTISNNLIELQFDTKTGLLSNFKHLSSGISSRLNQNFFWYNDPSGGAYKLVMGNAKSNKIAKEPVKLTKIEGPLVSEMRQVFGSWASQVVRLYKDKPYVEFEWTIGPTPIDDNKSKDVITRFVTDIKSDSVFYTDANGRQMMKRTRDYQPTYQYENSEPIAGNYFPVNSRIAIKDSKTQLTILTDRSQGGSSLSHGSVELMLHRRMLQDDWCGLNENLNETGPTGKGLVLGAWLATAESA